MPIPIPIPLPIPIPIPILIPIPIPIPIPAPAGAATPRGRSEARGGGQSRGANAADGGESDEASAAIPLGGREREPEAVGRVACGRCESGAAARAPCEGEGHTPRMSPGHYEMPGIGALNCR